MEGAQGTCRPAWEEARASQLPGPGAVIQLLEPPLGFLFNVAAGPLWGRRCMSRKQSEGRNLGALL
jgi:hypothetical protein